MSRSSRKGRRDAEPNRASGDAKPDRPADEVPVDMECSGAPGKEGEIEMLSQDQSVDDMEYSGAEGENREVEMLSQSQTAQVPSRSQDAMVLVCNTTLPLGGAWRLKWKRRERNSQLVTRV